MPDYINKPWGGEILLSPPEAPYAAKILEILEGKKLSLQYHDQKTETLTLFSGKTEITWGQTKETLITEEMIPLKPYHIKPGTIHRFTAITDSKIFEASSKEVGTTVRIEDDFNRPDETETIRNLPNRGWNPPPNENS